MRRVMDALRDLGSDAWRRYDDRRRRQWEAARHGLQDALAMFDYDGQDDPC
jgi:hypothetical protein